MEKHALRRLWLCCLQQVMTEQSSRLLLTI